MRVSSGLPVCLPGLAHIRKVYQTLVVESKREQCKAEADEFVENGVLNGSDRSWL